MHVSQLNSEGYFKNFTSPNSRGRLPHGCVDKLPPAYPWAKTWPKFNDKKNAFDMIPDHRQRRVEEGFAPEQVQEATEYWLPPPHGDDTHQSPARTMAKRGPLPEGAVICRPEKSLAAAQDEKRREVAAAHEAALAGSVALSDPTPSTVAVESALLAVQDAAGLEYISGVLNTRRAELLAAVDAAGSAAEVEAIAVGYPV